MVRTTNLTSTDRQITMVLTQKKQKKVINALIAIALITIIISMFSTLYESHNSYNSVQDMVKSAAYDTGTFNKNKQDAKKMIDNIQSTMLFQVGLVGFCVAFVGVISSFFMSSTFSPVVTVNFIKLISEKEQGDKQEDEIYSVVICNEGTQDLFIHKAYIGTEEATCDPIEETTKQATHMLDRGKPIALTLNKNQSNTYKNHTQSAKIYLSTNEGKVICKTADEIWTPGS